MTDALFDTTPTAASAQQLAVFVPGRPAPQGSIRAIVHKSTGRAVAIKDNNDRQKTWRADIREALLDDTGQPRIAFGDAAVAVELRFVMPRPASTPKRRTPPAIRKPDVDKLARNLLDALTSAGVVADDARVVRLVAEKRLAEIGETAGCHITITPLED